MSLVFSGGLEREMRRGLPFDLMPKEAERFLGKAGGGDAMLGRCLNMKMGEYHLN